MPGKMIPHSHRERTKYVSLFVTTVIKSRENEAEGKEQANMLDALWKRVGVGQVTDALKVMGEYWYAVGNGHQRAWHLLDWLITRNGQQLETIWLTIVTLGALQITEWSRETWSLMSATDMTIEDGDVL